jgi:hypothetical protein
MLITIITSRKNKNKKKKYKTTSNLFIEFSDISFSGMRFKNIVRHIVANAKTEVINNKKRK